ncbi:hypothetical protein [Actinomarinicola tropica]|uniref:Cell division protein FtsL n=1 Tax=Actinomarinicola tropica TaxID=2789776 RepID=A0A5Q2RKV4_9ACTN|nr:hypothetical protein [Actinomarinicola tropica]QGG95552.1 hypothetical protein GH723_10850 [Actinomarinicola tropica]
MSVLTTGESRRLAAAAEAAAARATGAPARRRAPGVPDHGPRTAPSRPPLRLVEPPARPKRLSVGLLSTMCLVAVFLGVFALAAMHSLVVQAQFEKDRLEQSVAERRDQIDARRVEVARLESPAAVVASATELGMVVPEDRVYLLPDAPADGTVPAPPPDEPGLAAP